MDALEWLREDHRTICRLFRELEKAKFREGAQRRDLARRIVEETRIHAALEEELFYPLLRKEVPDAKESILEALEEHALISHLLSQIERMTGKEERFEAKVAVLRENVEHHIEEEETGIFHDAGKGLGERRLQNLGERLAAAKERKERPLEKTGTD